MKHIAARHYGTNFFIINILMLLDNFLQLNKDKKEITALRDKGVRSLQWWNLCTGFPYNRDCSKIKVYKVLNGSEPKYFMDLLVHHEPLRSSCTALHGIPKIMTKRREAAIQFEASKAWNKPPENLGLASTLQLFKIWLEDLLDACWSILEHFMTF